MVSMYSQVVSSKMLSNNITTFHTLLDATYRSSNHYTVMTQPHKPLCCPLPSWDLWVNTSPLCWTLETVSQSNVVAVDSSVNTPFDLLTNVSHTEPLPQLGSPLETSKWHQPKQALWTVLIS